MLLLSLLLVVLCQSVHSYVHTIRNADEFISFSKSVNNGNSYSGTTVLLENDIDCSSYYTDKFVQIGKREDTPFAGVFDGQGHTISNLALRTTSSFFTMFGYLNYQYVGLFGYSDGAVIKNIVIDSSCSFTNAYDLTGHKLYTGSIIGMCSSRTGPCEIKNNVNMAKISFEGKTDMNTLIGGIAGYLHFEKHPIFLMNCVNYGSIAHYGKSYQWVELGGIVGVMDGYSYSTSYVRNCLNYGSLIDKGSSGLSAIGGIAAVSYSSLFDNCVNLGGISSNKISNFTGAVLGKAKTASTLKHCYWSKDIKYSTVGYSASKVKYSCTHSFNPDTFIINAFSLIRKFLVKELDAVAVSNSFLGYSHWAFNKDNFVISFTREGRKIGPTVDSKVILLPETKDRRNLVLSLCKDRKCKKRFSLNANKIRRTSVIDASWMFKSYTVTFDLGNSITMLSTFDFNETIVFPRVSERKGYTFKGWDKKITRMPGEDIVIKAVWKRNYWERVDDDDDGGKGTSSRNKSPNIKVLSIVLSTVIFFSTFVWSNKDNGRSTSQQATSSNPDTKISNGKSHISPNSSSSTLNSPKIFRAVVSQKEFDEENISSRKTLSKLNTLYPSDYTRPSLENALFEVGLPEEKVNLVCSACTNAVESHREREEIPKGFTEDDAAAIAMYTYDFGEDDFESNPYRFINSNLAKRNYAGLQKASGLLYLVMTALRKLPRVTDKTLYRGVQSKMNLDEDHYCQGNVIIWPALSSTSPDLNATKEFLAKGSTSGNAAGTLFIIENGWGYDIQPYSLFPDEGEILLELERQFKVVSVIEAELTIIKLEMLDTPLCLADVFNVSRRGKKRSHNKHKKVLNV